MGQKSTFSLRMFFIALAVLCGLALPSKATAACKLRVGWDEWPPYITYENGRFQGLEYDLLKKTANAAGCTLEMVHVPWKRALRMLRKGSLDLLYGADYSKERARFAQFSIPYRRQAFVLVTRGKAKHKNPSISLKAWIHSAATGRIPHALGLFLGDSYGQKIDDILRENKKNVIIARLHDNRQMTAMLARGRLDGYIVEEGVARMQVETAGIPMHGSIIQEQVTDPLYYMFSRKVSVGIVKRFNAVIRRRQSKTGAE